MRILSVKFLNLNSLKGEHTIHFNRAPFTESGLFAITGPTGAGKTTILDAITVALYGKVHRHDKNVEEMMSRHTAECYAEVEFEVNRNNYRAKWSLKKSRGKANGTVQTEKMELSDVATNKFVGGHTTTSTKQAIIQLCGLDYHQFLRSVILSQGDFTRFLKANDNERSELLEKITDTGIYSEISIFVYDKQREEKEQLEVLSQKLAGVEVLSEEERNLHRSRLDLLLHEKEAFNEQQRIVKRKIEWRRELIKLTESKNRISEELIEKQKLFSEYNLDFERLVKHHKAVIYEPALAEISMIREQAARNELSLKELSKKLPEAQKEIETALHQLEASDENVEQSQNKIKETEPLLEKIAELDSNINNTIQQVGKYTKQYEQAIAVTNDLKIVKDVKAANMLQLQQELNNLIRWLKENDKDKDLDKQLIIFKQYHIDLEQVNQLLDAALKEQMHYTKLEQEERKILEESIVKIELLKKELAGKEALLKRLTERINEEFQGKVLEILETEYDKLPSLITNCEQQYKLSASYKKNKEQKVILKENIDKLKISFNHHTVSLQLLTNEKEGAEQHLADLRQVLELEQRIQKYEADRKQLKHEQPCPLCGSVVHPYREGSYQNEMNETERKKNEQEQYVSSLLQKCTEKSLEVNTGKLTLEAEEKSLTKYISDIEDYKNEFEKVNLLLPKALDIEKSEIIVAIIDKKKQQQSHLQNQIIKLRGLHQQINDAQNAIGTKRELFISIQGEAAIFQEKISNTLDAIKRTSLLMEQYKEKQTAIIAGLKMLLTPYHIDFDNNSIASVEALLIQRCNKYIQSLKDLQQLELTVIQLQTELIHISDSLIEKVGEQEKRSNELKYEKEKLKKQQEERRKYFGEKHPGKERERLHGELKSAQDLREKSKMTLHQKQEVLNLTNSKLSQFIEESEHCKQKLLLLTNTLELKLKAEGISSINSLELLFLPEDELQRLTAMQKNMVAAIAALEQVLRSTEDELQKVFDKKLTGESEQQLRLESENLTQHISALDEERGKLNTILEKDNSLKTKYAAITALIETQKKEFAKWRKLSDLIGSADGKKFRRFAQGLTLARLTDLANRHLIKLSDRYQILKGKENDLELLIIDRYQADVVRPMATLSGGESFLVSLALALGLSDLASRKVQIDSLFIDEGFGTLDSDTLDTAISALENLQSKGKTIGIISHVEALKERISVQIKVQKQHNGYSRIKITNYGVEVG